MRKWYPWLIVIAAAGFSLAVVNRLPDRVPTHYDLRGVANGWSSPAVAAWVMPGVIAVMALILPLLPSIDPRRENFIKFRPTYDLVVNAVVTMVGVLHVALLGKALGWPISVERITPLMTGALFIFLGNVMPRARSNWWFGIRTPWTLSNDRVWERTHRLGGYLFVGAGTLLMLLTVAPQRLMMPVFIAVCVSAGLIPLVYSYFAWRQETAR
jgi:uncharacterized membrane protein